MDSRTMTLAGVLTREVRYTVPLFQRKYVWKRDKNLWPLWTDVVETASRLMDDRALNLTSTRPHFLGALVHEGLPPKTGQMPEHRLIDGQQRMTTLQLLLSAVRTIASGRGLATQTSRIGRLVDNPDDAVQEGFERYKVWPTNADRDAFVAAMSDAPDETLIGTAYAFFKTRAADFIETGSGGTGPGPDVENDWSGPVVGEVAEQATPERRLDALIDTLRDLIRVVVIELDGTEDDSQVIFETLNATGTALLPSDLVKNHLFSRAQIAGLDVGMLNDKYWSPLDDKWFVIEEAVGRTKRTRLDLAINFWTALANPRGSDVSHTYMFEIFREVARFRSGPMGHPDKDSVEELFADVSHHACVYRKLRTAPYDSVEGRFMTRLADLDTSTPMPLVLWLAGQLDHAVTRPQFERALNAIESYLVRRAACGMTAKNYNRVFAQVLEQAKKCEISIVGDEVTKVLLEFTEETVRWPEDDEFELALREEPQYRRPLRTKRVRMVLEAIEAAMRGPDVEQLAPPTSTVSAPDAPAGAGVTRGGKALTVEHVLPQKWEEHWSPEGLTAEETQDETARRWAALHRLGNLTLVTGSKNTEMSNQAWPVKRGYLSQRSLLMLTQATVLASPATPGHVRKHGPKQQEQDALFGDLWASHPTEAIGIRGFALAMWAVEVVWPRG
jgi:Protein of unknown function DUF262/Protein of unknown function (DUF1524)